MNRHSSYDVTFIQPGPQYKRLRPQLLYIKSRFIQLKEGYDLISCYHLDHSQKRIANSISFLCKHKIAISLPESPFGGFQFNEMREEVFSDFVESIIKHFAAKKFKRLIIKNPSPIYHSAQQAAYVNDLVKYGFSVLNKAVNHHVVVDTQAFEEKIHKMEFRKLKKAVKESLVFEEFAIENLTLVHTFISKCRLEKGIEINISLSQLEKTFHAFPTKYKIFAVTRKEEIIAATIAVIISDQIVYNYLPASNTLYNNISPMVYLLKELYQYCQQNGVKILDLGISTLNNKPQKNLIGFKERVGAIASSKQTFQLEFPENS